MKRKLIGMVALCFVATFLNAAQDAKEALESYKEAIESFKKYLAAARAEWDYTTNAVKKVNRDILAARDTNVPMQTFDVQTNCQFSALAADESNAAVVAHMRTTKHHDSIPEKLDKADLIAFCILNDLTAREAELHELGKDKLVKTKIPAELVRERDALLAQSRSFGKVLIEAEYSSIEQDRRAATDKILDGIRRNADDHIADSDRAWSPVAISLLPPVQWPRADADIMGLGLNVLAGNYHNVYGVEFAIFGNVVSNCTAGIQLAGFGNNSDAVYGFQLAALQNYAVELVGGAQISLANINMCYGSWLQVGGLRNDSGFFEGAQIAGLLNSAYSCKGLQIGSVNQAKELSGFQLGILNAAEKKMSGFQLGILNGAKKMSGFQIGVVNAAGWEMSGFQIGVFNHVEKKPNYVKKKANALQVGVLNYIDDATCSCLPLLNMHF